MELKEIRKQIYKNPINEGFGYHNEKLIVYREDIDWLVSQAEKNRKVQRMGIKNY